jgi:hypothetical protein
MIPEDDEILDHDDIILVLRIVILEVLEYFEFDESLREAILFATDHFHSSVFLALMVEHLDDRAEGALTNVIDDLVAVRDVIMLVHLIDASWD